MSNCEDCPAFETCPAGVTRNSSACAREFKAASVEKGDTCPACEKGRMVETAKVDGFICRKGPLTCSTCGWEKGDILPESTPPRSGLVLACGEDKTAIWPIDALRQCTTAGVPLRELFDADTARIQERLDDAEDERAWVKLGKPRSALDPAEAVGYVRPKAKIQPTEHTAPEITRAMDAIATGGGHLLGSKGAFGEG